MATSSLLDAARTGDEEAFRQLVEPYPFMPLDDAHHKPDAEEVPDMNEASLSHELRRVLDAAPVPTDLFPPGLTSRRSRKPRSRWLAVAAAAAALVVFSLTPLAGQVVTAAGEFLMQYTVRLVFVDDPEAASPIGRFPPTSPRPTTQGW